MKDNLNDYDRGVEELRRDTALLLTKMGATDEDNTVGESDLIEAFANRGWNVTTEELVSAATHADAKFINYEVNVGDGETTLELMNDYAALGYTGVNFVDGEVEDRFGLYVDQTWLDLAVPHSASRDEGFDLF